MHKKALLKRIILGLMLCLIFCAAMYYGIGSEALAKNKDDLLYLGGQHLYLVGISMGLALLVGIPSGIALSRPWCKHWAEYGMQLFNIGNTVPSLAVLALAMAVVGIGDRPAIVALFLASLLPIVRNTYAGLVGLPPALLEAADALGMTTWQRLWQVGLPNALPVILSGVRIALAINVGTVPLAVLIGASGYGEMIFTGIQLNENKVLLLGAVATALIALILDFIVACFGKVMSHRGIA